MAHKKRKHKRVSGVKRRRKHSAMHGIDLSNIGGVIAGAVIAGYLNKIVPATVNDKILAGGKVALGVALPMISKDGKTKNLLAGIGSGLIAVGAVDLLKSFGALSGDFDIPVINGDVLSGDDDSVINGDEFGADEMGGDEMGDVLAGEEEMGADEMGGDDE